MEKYALIRKKRDQAISKRFQKINRRTFPPSSFQLTPLIETTDDLIVCISEANQPYANAYN